MVGFLFLLNTIYYDLSIGEYIVMAVLTQTKLKQIIKEELQKVLKEYIEIDPNDSNSDEVQTLSVMFKPPFNEYTIHQKLFDILAKNLGWYESEINYWNGELINSLIKDPNNSLFWNKYQYTEGNRGKAVILTVVITKNSDNNYSVSIIGGGKGREKTELINNQNIDDIFKYFEDKSKFSKVAKQIADEAYEASGGIAPQPSGGKPWVGDPSSPPLVNTGTFTGTPRWQQSGPGSVRRLGPRHGYSE